MKICRRRARCKSSRAFVDFRSRPIRPGKFMRIQVFLPAIIPADIRRAAAIGISRSPFRNEHGKARIHRRQSIRPFAIASPTIRSIPAMGICIIMESVGGIFFGVRDFITDNFLRILIPRAGSNENQIIGILSNGRHYLIRVIFNRRPRNIRRFIVDFKNHVIILPISLRHFTKESHRVGSLFMRIMGMPVDNHINIIFYGRFYDGFDKLFLIIGIARISFERNAVPRAAPILCSRRHGRPHYLDFHVVHHRCHARIGPELHRIWQKAPIKAHSANLNFGTILNAFARTVNLSLAA